MRKMPRGRLSVILVLSSLALAGCRPQAATPTGGPTIADLGSTRPAFQWGSVYLGGQPSEADFEIVRDLGVRTVVDLRQPGEINWNEAAVVEGLGMKYVALPFRTPEELTPELLDKSLGILRDSSQHPVLVHCASNNRTGAIWYAYRRLDGGLSPAAAQTEAQSIGLRTMAYLDPVRKYVAERLEVNDEMSANP